MFKNPNEERIHNLEKALEMLTGCECRRLEIRYREASNSNKMYTRQCLDCGKIVRPENGMWIKQSEISNIENIKPIDDDLAKNISTTDAELRDSLRLRLREAEKSLKLEEYYEYLKSPEWKEKRQLVMDRAGYICEGCLQSRANNVHHKTYANIYNEFLFELVALCRQCHESIHDIQKENEAI